MHWDISFAFGCHRSNYRSRAVSVSNVILENNNRSDSTLLTSDYRIEVGIVYITFIYHFFHQ